MVLTVSNANNVKVYSITSASKSAIPDWLAKKNKKSLKYDEEYRRRIELIQDFEFPEASLKLKMTPDKKHIVATGVYKPQMRVFELNQLAMKFERHYDCENVQFQILSDDWTKVVFLQSDRSIEFHSQSGMHYKTRVPKFGRDIVYDYPTCDLLTVGASNQVWRLNLELGKFMNSLETEMPGINTAVINPAHQLWGFGGENGMVELWHPFHRNKIGSLDVASILFKSLPSGSFESFPEITQLIFHNNGLTFAAGTSTGQVALFDIRRPTPIIIKDHQYGFPIKSLSFHQSGNVISADTKIIKIWDQYNGDSYTNIEPNHDINDVLNDGESGLIMVANEGVQIQSYYLPSLGTAPKWCSFLDNLTEELEENPSQTIYDDYKFITRKELTQLGLDHLIGTNVLKAYMHGFFVDLRLYEKAKAIANPFSYEEFKRQKIQDKIQKERTSRISAIKKLPRINRSLAQRLMKDTNGDVGDHGLPDDETNTTKRQRTPDRSLENATAENPTGDDRFKDLFIDPEFQVDENDPEYILRHPSQTKIPAQNDENDEDDEDDEDDYENEGIGGHPLMRRANPNKLGRNLSLGDALEKRKEKDSNTKIVHGSHGNAIMTFSYNKKIGAGHHKFRKPENRQEGGRGRDQTRRRRNVKELGLRKPTF